MTERKLVEAAKSGDVTALEALLSGGADANEQDELGWTPLSWAAGRGDVAAVKVLLSHGADVSLTGRDRRTPLMIARAATRQGAVALLTEAEQRAGTWVDPRTARPYCRAYYMRDLRSFAGWSESRRNGQEPSSPAAAAPAGEEAATVGLSDDDVVYLHQDLTVTTSIWHGESVVFDQRPPGWEEFCVRELEFAIPEDLA